MGDGIEDLCMLNVWHIGCFVISFSVSSRVSQYLTNESTLSRGHSICQLTLSKIHKRHSEAIHAEYAGDKNLIIVEGDHNSPRPKFMFDSVSIFLQTCLQIPNSWALKTVPGMNLMAPPWYFPGTPDPLEGDLLGINSPKRTLEKAAAETRRDLGDVVGDDDLTAADEAAAALAAETSEELGMTSERQKEIQASLFKMLGSAEPDGGASGEEDNDTEKEGPTFLKVNAKERSG